jgi:Leucine-rich repeat (LRR) protein
MSQHYSALVLMKMVLLQCLLRLENYKTSLSLILGISLKIIISNLYIRFNKITSLPSEIGNLKKLKQLHLRYNKLTTLPDTITNLSELESLSLRANKLLKLPARLGVTKNDDDDDDDDNDDDDDSSYYLILKGGWFH